MGNLPVGPVTFARDLTTGYLTRREGSAASAGGAYGGGAGTLALPGPRALQRLPPVTYKVPNGTYESVGESTLVGFAVQANSSQYPASKGLFFSTGSSIRRVVEVESAMASKGDLVVAGVSTVVIHGHRLGSGLQDIAMVLVKGTVCSSVFYRSSTEIGCVSGHPSITTATRLTPYDIKVATVTSGTSEDVPILNWQVRLAEGYTAPIVTSVDLHHHSFHPTCLVVDHHNALLYVQSFVMSFCRDTCVVVLVVPLVSVPTIHLGVAIEPRLSIFFSFYALTAIDCHDI